MKERGKANEMHHKPQALATVEARQACIGDTSRVVRNGAHDTPAVFGQTVAGYVDAALVRRIVLGVDIVPSCCVGEGGHVSDFIGEQGRFGYILAV
jgi:hypothetical protein